MNYSCHITENSSTGISDRRSIRGASYKKRKDYYKVNKIIIVGHSGAADMAALILGRHRGISNRAILALLQSL
jgi:hypothetical protein